MVRIFEFTMKFLAYLVQAEKRERFRHPDLTMLVQHTSHLYIWLRNKDQRWFLTEEPHKTRDYRFAKKHVATNENMLLVYRKSTTEIRDAS